MFLYRYPGTSYLATIVLSLRDKIHSLAETLRKVTLMGFNPEEFAPSDAPSLGGHLKTPTVKNTREFFTNSLSGSGIVLRDELTNAA